MVNTKLTKKNALSRIEKVTNEYHKLVNINGLSKERACMQLAKKYKYGNHRSVSNAIATYEKKQEE